MLNGRQTTQEEYTLSQDFLIKRFIEKSEGRITGIFPMNIHIPRTFEFHKKGKHRVKVDLYRVEGKSHA